MRKALIAAVALVLMAPASSAGATEPLGTCKVSVPGERSCSGSFELLKETPLSAEARRDSVFLGNYRLAVCTSGRPCYWDDAFFGYGSPDAHTFTFTRGPGRVWFFLEVPIEVGMRERDVRPPIYPCWIWTICEIIEETSSVDAPYAVAGAGNLTLTIRRAADVPSAP